MELGMIEENDSILLMERGVAKLTCITLLKVYVVHVEVDGIQPEDFWRCTAIN